MGTLHCGGVGGVPAKPGSYILVFCKDISLLLYRCVARAKTPPYTGYGSWEDSMGSVTHLVPKLPKKERSMSGSKCTQRV